MDPSPVAFLVALGIGALIGLEREKNGAPVFAASRTFPLIALLAAAAQTFFPHLLVWGFLAVALLAFAGYVAKVRRTGHLGSTTAVAALVTFVLGAMAVHSPEAQLYAIVIGAGTAALLAAKEPLHAFAYHISRDERFAMAKFIVLALVVLPLLPDRPLDVLWGLNPRFVWLMVVLISAIDLVGYLFAHYWGRRGMGLTGILGGFVSSTATTVSMANRAKAEPRLVRVAAFAAIAATLVSMPRVLLEVAVVNRSLLGAVVLPVAAMVLSGSAVAVWMLVRSGRDEVPETVIRNPFRLAPALWFGALFAFILLASDLLAARFGGAGIYATAVLSGLADVDAPTLSFARLASEGNISERLAARGIVVALLSNLAVKVGIAGFLGGRRFMAPVALAAAAIAAAGITGALLI